MQQEGVVCDFVSSDSWVILSPIEQSIKRKIEAVGTPLKDWDIQINYGIKTGFNDAFIINTEKRDEILANCQTEDERNRTAELIRPILRGRDIKRYEYEWADLWIIATFPSRHYDIESYPAVKNYLLSIGIERLEQTGETHIVNGKKIKARKKTCNEWFETQDSISYWEDFSKPKIVWAELARTGNAFALDFGNNMVGNTGYILTVPSNNQDELLYLLAFLNSRSMLYSLNQITTRFDENGWRWLRQFVEQLRVPPLINKNEILSIVATVTKDNKQEVSEILNNVIADIYNFTDEEKAYINQTLSNY
ncbi:class I SAM-dependent DNA methyltransferase [Bacteroides uniformis]|nr:class I SAM-dependent DNA methyltransferase [Bacteroides uniformis]